MTKPKSSKLPTRIFITLLGFAFIVWGLATITLGFIGDDGTAVITDIRREGGERNEVKRGSYTYNISYTFTLPNGKSVNGFTKTVGNAIYLKADGKSKAPVKYLSFFPYINSLKQDTKPGFGQLILVAVGCFLIFIMNRRKKEVARKTE
ncbi:MAG: hypothetical protein PHP53_15820 [Prolixibacteraceae bacterium]|nr:hypothetical protein [Prolixibacteraceae bacterium]